MRGLHTLTHNLKQTAAYESCFLYNSPIKGLFELETQYVAVYKLKILGEKVVIKHTEHDIHVCKDKHLCFH